MNDNEILLKDLKEAVNILMFNTEIWDEEYKYILEIGEKVLDLAEVIKRKKNILTNKL